MNTVPLLINTLWGAFIQFIENKNIRLRLGTTKWNRWLLMVSMFYIRLTFSSHIQFSCRYPINGTIMTCHFLTWINAFEGPRNVRDKRFVIIMVDTNFPPLLLCIKINISHITCHEDSWRWNRRWLVCAWFSVGYAPTNTNTKSVMNSFYFSKWIVLIMLFWLFEYILLVFVTLEIAKWKGF